MAQSGGRRALLTLVIVMGVLIVAGVAVIGVTIARRVTSGPSVVATAVPWSGGFVTLDQPTGTRIAGVMAVGDRLGVLLTGGGPDRVMVLDARTGALTGGVSLGR